MTFVPEEGAAASLSHDVTGELNWLPCGADPCDRLVLLACSEAAHR